MPLQIPTELKTYHAWTFNSVLSGTFRRRKADFAHHEYPILAPLPTNGAKTRSREASDSGGPYVYFVCDDNSHVRYVGKSQEKDVLVRWIRPGVGGPTSHYWTHSTKAGGCVFSIAEALASGESKHFSVRYLSIAEMSPSALQRCGIPTNMAIEGLTGLVESALITICDADWNRQ